jgi:hypothetical protein
VVYCLRPHLHILLLLVPLIVGLRANSMIESNFSSSPSCGSPRNPASSCPSRRATTRGYPASSSCSRYASPPASRGRGLLRRLPRRPHRASNVLELARGLGARRVLNKGGVSGEKRGIDVVHARSAAIGHVRGGIERGVVLRALERVWNRGLHNKVNDQLLNPHTRTQSPQPKQVR